MSDETTAARPAEFDLIRRLAAVPHPAVTLGIGDDAAVLHTAGPLIVCTDLVAEGVHFTPDTPPELIGRKALAVNLSDAAAMAARPIAAFVGLLADRRRGFAHAEAVMRGVSGLAAEYGVCLAGGDTASHAGPVSVCVTVVGAADRPVRRDGARPGDWLLVTGTLGRSLQSGRHLTFPPRVTEAAALAAAVDLHAMLDLSDGLLADCGRLCEASGVGAGLEAAAIPRSPDAADLSAALTDGEDFELLFAVAPADGRRLLKNPPVTCGLTRVGGVTAGAGVIVRDAKGVALAFDRAGYEHGFAS